MCADKTGLDFLNEILADRTAKPVWLATQARNIIIDDCAEGYTHVLKTDDRFTGPVLDDAKGLLREYTTAKIASAAQQVHTNMSRIMPQGKPADFTAWFNAEALTTLKGQLEQADFTDDQQQVIFAGAAKAEMVANRKLAIARQDYEFQLTQARKAK